MREFEPLDFTHTHGRNSRWKHVSSQTVWPPTLSLSLFHTEVRSFGWQHVSDPIVQWRADGSTWSSQHRSKQLKHGQCTYPNKQGNNNHLQANVKKLTKNGARWERRIVCLFCAKRFTFLLPEGLDKKKKPQQHQPLLGTIMMTACFYCDPRYRMCMRKACAKIVGLVERKKLYVRERESEKKTVTHPTVDGTYFGPKVAAAPSHSA